MVHPTKDDYQMKHCMRYELRILRATGFGATKRYESVDRGKAATCWVFLAILAWRYIILSSLGHKYYT